MKYLKSELDEILKKHSAWINDEDGGVKADLYGADLTGANLTGADLDYSTLYFACKSLSAKFSNKIIIQILYHAAMPTQHNALALDDDVKALFNSEQFRTVVNKFHRVEECGAFTGCKEKEREL